MRNTNLMKTTNTITTYSDGVVVEEKVSTNSGPSYGKISVGSGMFKQSYEGENPIKNLFLASCISLGSFIIKTASATAVPLIVVWGLKKMGIIGDDTNDHNVPNVINSCDDDPLVLIPKPQIGSFRGDVAQAIEQGKPENILASEIHKGSRVIFFSGTGVGKSAMAAQMGIEIGYGKPSSVFPSAVKSTPQNVLLIDTEQDETDLYLRYANGMGEIPESMERVSDCNFNSPEEVVTLIKNKVLEWTNDGTVIIDNITSAFSLQNGERIRIFFNQLRGIQKSLKSRGITISYIIICHETKSAKGVTLKDIQGSGNIGNFATAVYGLEKVSDDLVKMKVLKNRRSPNVGKAYLEKLCAEPYLHFEIQQVLMESEINKTKTSMSSSIVDTQQEQIPSTNPNGRKCSPAQIEEMRKLYREGVSINKLHQLYCVNNRIVRKYLGLKH